MYRETLTAREQMILRLLFAKKGIFAYEIVGAQAAGRTLPGGLYEGEVEALHGYVVGPSTVHFFWLDWDNAPEEVGAYTLGEADGLWQEIERETLPQHERIAQIQRRLQQQQAALSFSLPLQTHSEQYYASRRQEGDAHWEGPVFQQQDAIACSAQPIYPLSTSEASGVALRWAEFSPNGTSLLTDREDAYPQVTRIWETQRGRLLITLGQQKYLSHHVPAAYAFSPSGAQVGMSYVDEHTAHVWHIGHGEEQRTLQGHLGYIMSLAFSPDGTWLATGSDDSTACLWDVASGQRLFLWQPSQFGPVQVFFSPDGARLATASWDRTVRVWDTTSGDLLTTLRGHADAVTGVAFSPDGMSMLTSSMDHTARLWETTSGACLTTLQGHRQAVTGGAFSPDGSLLFTRSQDYLPRLWDAATGRCLAVLEGVQGDSSSIFSPHGQFVVTIGMLGEAGIVYLWQATGPQMGKLLGIFHCCGERGLVQIIATRWVGNHHLLLANQGGSDQHPCIFQLSLEDFLQ